MNNFDPYDKTLDGPAIPIPPGEAGIAEHPQRIGRYRIEKVLGKGGFGIVYLAHDEQLNRRVAVKLPHAKLISKPEDAEAYLAEARTVASLDHPRNRSNNRTPLAHLDTEAAAASWKESDACTMDPQPVSPAC